MPLVHLDKYSEVFVETGTLNGAGIVRALNSGYNKVISIELDENFYKVAKESFTLVPNVEVVHGDSGLVLGEVIENINEKITFFLDGHYSGHGTACGIHEYPLLPELNHIKNHSIKDHVIMIDDLRLWKNYDKELNLENVMTFIKTINEKYEFYTIEGHIEDDVLVCIVK